jgi:hypothetical protein
MLLVPSIATLQPAAARSPAWPPAAWTSGDVGKLSLEQISAILAGVGPDTPGAASIQAGLDRLKELPPVYTDVARATLEGLAGALWHQQQAMAHLSDGQRALLLAAQRGPVPPEGQADPALKSALASLDFQEVLAAQAALQQASAQVLALLAQPASEASVAQALAEHLGVPTPAPAAAFPQQSAAQVLAGIQATAGAPLDAKERRALEQALQAIPDGPRAALGGILDALRPFAAGPPADPAAALVALGQAIDQARPVLQVWSGLVTADQVWRMHAAPPLSLPDPDALVPPLRIGLPALTDGRLPRAPALADALRAVAASVGDQATAGAAAERVAPLAPLPQAQQDAIAQVWMMAANSILAQHLAAATPIPAGLRATPGLLDQWHQLLASGSLPAPGSPQAEALLAALPYLEAQRGAAAAAQDLLVAVEQAVPLFARQSQATPADPQCYSNGLNHRTLNGYLALDLCGEDSTWAPGEQALLVLDTGGDNAYTGRFGGAPFQFVTGAPDLSGVQAIVMPVSLSLDVGGGSNTYTSTQPCAQGAACPGLDAGPDPTALPDEAVGTPNPAPAALSTLSPMGILIDWKPDGSVATDTFTAVGRSQGYAGREGAPAALGPFTDRAYGILVERVGDSGTLHSTFHAGNLAQGSAINGKNAPLSDQVAQHDSEGILLRLIASNAVADAELVAGDYSQGASTGTLNLQGTGLRRVALGALLNVAGRDAASHTAYTAGHHAQGAIFSDAASVAALAASALFVDVAGPGSRGGNRYTSGDHARGEVDQPRTVNRPFGITEVDLSPRTAAAFVSGVVPTQPDATGAVTVTGLAIDAKVPVPPASSGADTYSPVANGMGHAGGLFLDTSGSDSYPACAAPCPANDAVWGSTGVDTGALDFTGDALPGGVGRLWSQFVHLWDSDGGGSVLPAPGHVLLNLDGTQLHLDEPYALVLSAASAQNGPSNDWYGPGFSATVHIDLGGHDTYAGRAGAAFGVAQRAQELPHDDSEALLALLGQSGAPAFHSPVPAIAPPRDEAGAPFQNHFLSFSLNTQGGNRYESALGGNQGFGAQGASGLLFNLGGGNRYTAPLAAQGVGIAHGLGVLVDLQDPSVPEPNWFHVDGAPRQGAGMGGGLGILVANGSHNTYQDNPEADTPLGPVPAPAVSTPPGEGGTPQAPSGVSYNGGANAAPTITAWKGPFGAASGPLQVNTPYLFAAEAEDADGDPLTFCWTFQHGGAGASSAPPCVETLSGRAEVAYAWADVATDNLVPAIAESVDERVTLTVTDSGGKQATQELAYHVRNLPLTIPDLGLLLGERAPRMGQAYAYQLPFVPGPAGEAPSLLVDWGDGQGPQPAGPATDLPDPQPFPYNIDWANKARGGSLQIPDGYANGPALSACCADAAGRSLEGAIGDGSLPTVLRHDPDATYGPMAALALFAGPRQVSRVTLAIASPDSGPTRLSLEAIRPDGSLLHLGSGTLVVPAGAALGPSPAALFSFDLPAMPALTGLQLSQVVAPGEADAQVLRVMAIRALGPGALHQWTVPGPFDVAATLVNHFGGRSHPAQATRVTVAAPSEDLGGTPAPIVPPGQGPAICTASAAATGGPILFENVGGQSRVLPGGRGKVCHASLVGSTPYSLTLRSNTNLPGTLDIDWGDGTRTTGLAVPPRGDLVFAAPETGQLPMKAWAASPEDYKVKVAYRPAGGAAQEMQVTSVHVEQGLDLRAVAQTPAGPGTLPATSLQQPEVPLLYLVLGGPGTPPEQTWHEGLQFLGIVDAGGDDRFTGKVAAPVLLAEDTLNQGARPGLAIAGPGRHDYLSSDDRDCLAANTGTQGYGAFGAVGLLLSIGDDRFVAHGCAQGSGTYGGIGALIHLGGDAWFNPLLATDPLVAGGYGSGPTPWVARPAALAMPHPAAPRPGMDYLQGAGLDGVGILVNAGGHGSFNAHSRSQGYGGHILADPPGYVPGSGCDPAAANVSCFIGVDNLPPGPSISNPTATVAYLVAYVNTIQASVAGQRLPKECILVPSSPAVGNPAVPLPCPPPDPSRLKEFLAHGPRYGPGLGVLLQGDGAASLMGADLAQGASGPSGRGLLLGSQGALVAASTQRSQAYSDGGSAGLVVGGPSVLRLQRDGQGALDHPDQSLAVLFGLQRDQACETGQGCGQALLPAAAEAALLTLLPSGLGVPGPGIQVTGLPAGAVTAQPVALQVHLASTDPLQTLGPAAGQSFELAAVRLTRAWSGDLQEVAAAPPPCSGPLLAAPTLLFHGTGLGATVPLPAMDPRTVSFPGAQPDVLAGCTEVVLWARQQAGSGTTAWSRALGVLHFLPPPRSFEAPASLFSDGASASFQVRVLDPLAALQPPLLSFRLLGCVTPGGQTCSFTAGPASWNGAVATVTLNPGAPGLASSFPDGNYALEVNAQWPGRQESSGWTHLMPVTLDRMPPAAVLRTLDDTAPNALPAAWRFAKPLHPGGTVSGRSLPVVHVRLLDDAGRPVPLKGGALGDPPCPDQGCAAATVFPSDGIFAWRSTVQPQDVFPGGLVHIQTRAQAGGHDSGWMEAGQVILDRAAPALVGVDTANGGHASRALRTLEVKVTVADTAVQGCAGCPGAGIDPASLQALLVNPTLADASLRVIPLQREPSLDAAGVVGFAWKPAHDIPQGIYQVEAMVRDRVGNLRALLPGQPIVVDQVGPTLGVPAVALPSFVAPDGQTVQQDRVRAGGQAAVSVTVADDFSVAAVEARLPGGARVPLALQATPQTGERTYAGTVPVTDADAPADSIPLQVAASDFAGNEALRTVQVPFSRASCAPAGLAAEPRSDALSFTWALPNPASQLFQVVGPDGPVTLPVQEFPPGSHSYRAQLRGLAEDTAYPARLRTWDTSGCLGDETLAASTLARPLGTLVSLNAFPAGVTRSGPVTVTGQVARPVTGTLTLHLGTPDGPTLNATVIRGGPIEQPFLLTWNSTASVPPTAHARNVTLVAVLDDGLSAFAGSTVVRVDNAPPAIPVSLVGPAPVNGWHAGTVRVAAFPFDDTGPLRTQVSTDGGTSYVTANATTLLEAHTRCASRSPTAPRRPTPPPSSWSSRWTAPPPRWPPPSRCAARPSSACPSSSPAPTPSRAWMPSASAATAASGAPGPRSPPPASSPPPAATARSGSTCRCATRRATSRRVPPASPSTACRPACWPRAGSAGRRPPPASPCCWWRGRTSWMAPRARPASRRSASRCPPAPGAPGPPPTATRPSRSTPPTPPACACSCATRRAMSPRPPASPRRRRPPRPRCRCSPTPAPPAPRSLQPWTRRRAPPPPASSSPPSWPATPPTPPSSWTSTACGTAWPPRARACRTARSSTSPRSASRPPSSTHPTSTASSRSRRASRPPRRWRPAPSSRSWTTSGSRRRAAKARACLRPRRRCCWPGWPPRPCWPAPSGAAAEGCHEARHSPDPRPGRHRRPAGDGDCQRRRHRPLRAPRARQVGPRRGAPDVGGRRPGPTLRGRPVQPDRGALRRHGPVRSGRALRLLRRRRARPRRQRRAAMAGGALAA